MKEVRGCVGVGASKQLSMARVLFYTQWTNIWLNLDHPMYMDIDTLIWLTQQTLLYLVACNILDFHVLLTQQNTLSHFHQWVGKNIYILRNFLNNFIWRIPTLYTYMYFFFCVLVVIQCCGSVIGSFQEHYQSMKMRYLIEKHKEQKEKKD